MANDLNKFFSPESIAVIGASEAPQKVGYAVFNNLVIYNFKGRVYPINPKLKELSGHKCYTSVLEIEDKIELAVIILPSKLVLQVLKECVTKKIFNVIIISAGFRESGIEGKKLEDEVKAFIQENNIRVVGPNCLGIIHTFSGMNASFSLGMPPEGGISFISQSGAICTGLIDWAREELVGLSKIVSFGNKIDLSEIDFLTYLKDDETTKVITLYLEEIRDGQNFIKVAREVSAEKPVLVLKSGVTQSGSRAVASHTGSLAGSQKAYETAFKKAGVIQCETLQDLIDYAQIFADQPITKGKNIAIVTNAGGPGILAADAAEKAGLTVATLETETTEKLRAELPPAANFHNPVDVLGDARSELYKFAVSTVLKDANIDAVLCLLTPQSMTDSHSFAEAIIKSSAGSDKPVVTSFIGGKEMGAGINLLKNNNVPNYFSPERAVKSLQAMVQYNQLRAMSSSRPKKIEVDESTIKNIFSKVTKENRVNLDEFEARKVVSSYGISVPEYGLARTAEEAKEISEKVGFPSVMKIVSPDILHKSDVGGVKLDLKNEKEAAEEFDLMISRSRKFLPNANIVGVTITKQVPKGREIIIGMTRDPHFGPMIMFGFGGIYVEVLKDVTFRIAPLSEKDADEMITELKLYPLLLGVRGEKPVDIESIKKALLAVSQLSVDFEEILELDINPLIVFEQGKGLEAVDVKITIRRG